MSQGLQTFTPSGEIIIDATSRIQKHLGEFYCGDNVRESSAQNSDLVGGALWYLVVPDSYPENIVGGSSTWTYFTPSVYSVGDKVYCKFNSDHIGCKIIYGVS